MFARFRLPAWSFPFLLIIVSILSYGLLLNKLGFYWDDWPWIWLYHIQGKAGLLGIDRDFRPLAGIVLWFGSLISGENPLGWQWLNLVYRWLAGLSLWWMLRKLWPANNIQTAWITLLFLVYPGFRQQFVSINSSRHILPLAFFFLSIGMMIWAEKDTRYYLLKTLLALILGILAMFTTEYYYGLELVRPVILWVIQDPRNSLLVRSKRTILHWLPYLGTLLFVFTWRYNISHHVNYSITLGDEIVRNPNGTIWNIFLTLGKNMVTSAIQAWGNLFDPTLFDHIDLQTTIAYIFLMMGSFVFIWFFLSISFKSRYPDYFPQDHVFDKQAIGVGLCCLVVGSLPFLVTGLPMRLDFPNDRTILPMILAGCLLVVGLLDLLIKNIRLKNLFVSLLVGMAIGMHFLTAYSYQIDWETQKSFFNQLTTRMPGIKPGTQIMYEYTADLQNFRSTDNSLKAPLNWIYSPTISNYLLPYNLTDVRLREEFRKEKLAKKDTFSVGYGNYTFEGKRDKLLIIQFSPPWCLQVLEPQLIGLYPNLPKSIRRVVNYSNPELIEIDASPPVKFPEAIFGNQPNPDWCIYYQQADLARQQKDWAKIVEIGDKALRLADTPRQPTERLPFILGYGYTGDWMRAEELTLETRLADGRSLELLCEVWDELENNTPDTNLKAEVIARTLPPLNCRY